jgi:hypothetical protein
MKFWVGFFLVLLVATPAYATSTGLPPIPPDALLLAPDPIGVPNQLRFVSSSTFLEHAVLHTQFTYLLQAGTPAPSNVVLALCLARFDYVTGWTPVVVGHDPNSDLTGIKLDNLTGTNLQFSVVLEGPFIASQMPYAVKAGPEVRFYTIEGPQCIPSAVTLVSFTAAPGAVPVAGSWKWTPGCAIPYPWGRWQSNEATCRRWQLPITYRWVWVP